MAQVEFRDNTPSGLGGKAPKTRILWHLSAEALPKFIQYQNVRPDFFLFKISRSLDLGPNWPCG